MGNLHLVTGYAGQPHVAAADQGSLFESLIRGGQFVMEAGGNFSASVVTNNLIRVRDGELLMQGRHVKMAPGSYVDLIIENGAQGYRRNDLIVARYTRNTENGIEECSLVVLKGTPVESNPADPETITGRINAENASQHDFPLYRVPLSGLNIGALEALFVPQKSVYEGTLLMTGGTMAGNIAMSGYKVTGLGTPKDDRDAVSLVYANGAYAPSGYGLGTKCTEIDNLDNALVNGYFVSGVGGPITGSYFHGLVVNYGNEIIVQKVWQTWGNALYSAERRKIDGAWTPWEWVNPPMVAGTEYRTTERYQSAAVYKKINSNGDILWRIEGESKWRLLSSASYVTDATVE